MCYVQVCLQLASVKVCNEQPLPAAYLVKHLQGYESQKSKFLDEVDIPDSGRHVSKVCLICGCTNQEFWALMGLLVTLYLLVCTPP